MKVLLPKIPGGITSTITDARALQRGESFDRVIIRGIEGVALVAPKLKFDESALDRAVLVNAALDEISLLDTEVRGCDISAAVLTSGALNRVRFTHCRMAGVDLSHCSLHNVTFTDCKIDMANFRFARLHGVVFEDCTLVETDFQLAEIREVAFENCRMERTIFTQSKVIATDMRSSHLENIRGWNSLKGATISFEQLSFVAPELAQELGIKVD